ncbi:glycosyltransferase family 2 protein [Sphingomonas pruni]|uniref:glycosyltransferase family 2 protein n=1 Tax=Sphingomonas pruni TaxID=40683 RepID=UPI000A04608D|nr:glycosyltransferase family A protein [Sphingomonas pruni]
MILPKVSVLFLTYNRAHTLVATYESFLARINYPRDRLELILCDDASHEFHQAIIRGLSFDVSLCATRNQGLGANTNKGVRAASGDFILQLQDDWLFVGEPDFLRDVIRTLQCHPDIGMIAFRERSNLAVAETREVDGSQFDILIPDLNDNGEIESVARGVYTDTPHVKRRNFHDIVGYYAEGIPMTKMELAMNRAVSTRADMVVAVKRGPETFRHIGEAYSFNPGAKREQLIQRIGAIPGGHVVLTLARSARNLFRR